MLLNNLSTEQQEEKLHNGSRKVEEKFLKQLPGRVRCRNRGEHRDHCQVRQDIHKYFSIKWQCCSCPHQEKTTTWIEFKSSLLKPVFRLHVRRRPLGGWSNCERRNWVEVIWRAKSPHRENTGSKVRSQRWFIWKYWRCAVASCLLHNCVRNWIYIQYDKHSYFPVRPWCHPQPNQTVQCVTHTHTHTVHVDGPI